MSKESKIKQYLLEKEVTIKECKGHIKDVEFKDNIIVITVKFKAVDVLVPFEFKQEYVTQIVDSPFEDIDTYKGDYIILAQVGYSFTEGAMVDVYVTESDEIKEMPADKV